MLFFPIHNLTVFFQGFIKCTTYCCHHMWAHNVTEQTISYFTSHLPYLLTKSNKKKKMDLKIHTVPLVYKLCLLTRCLCDQTFHKQTEIWQQYLMSFGTSFRFWNKHDQTLGRKLISHFLLKILRNTLHSGVQTKRTEGNSLVCGALCWPLFVLWCVLKTESSCTVSLIDESAALCTHTCPNSSFSLSLCNNPKVLAS